MVTTKVQKTNQNEWYFKENENENFLNSSIDSGVLRSITNKLSRVTENCSTLANNEASMIINPGGVRK